MRDKGLALFSIVLLQSLAAICPVIGQERAGQRPPDVVSPEVRSDRTITFRLHAPKATAVRLSAGDLPGEFGRQELAKKDNDVWETTVGPVPAGAYRYRFDVDQLPVLDPVNPATSESNANTWSLVNVPGSELFDAQQVPHGSIDIVTYYSKSLQRFRRMHVYTPPGYNNGQEKYPVFYLLHGAFDCDASWTTVGRAGFILDNLIATGKAKPMVVVMPAGHTGSFRFGPGNGTPFERQMEEFENDFTHDIRPYIAANFRVLTDRKHTAIAGLSMGGAQTLNIGFANLQDYAYLGVFSSGVFGITGGPGGAAPNNDWEQKHLKMLDDQSLRAGTKLVWFATGKDDFLLSTSQATVKMLEGHGLPITYKETDGGHTWLNWRDYLSQFAPLLFTE